MPSLPLVVMGALSLAGGLAALFLPETLRRRLPNTMEEGETLGDDFAFWSCPRRRRCVLQMALTALVRNYASGSTNAARPPTSTDSTPTTTRRRRRLRTRTWALLLRWPKEKEIATI